MYYYSLYVYNSHTFPSSQQILLEGNANCHQNQNPCFQFDEAGQWPLAFLKCTTNEYYNL